MRQFHLYKPIYIYILVPFIWRTLSGVKDKDISTNLSFPFPKSPAICPALTSTSRMIWSECHTQTKKEAATAPPPTSTTPPHSELSHLVGSILMSKSTTFIWPSGSRLFKTTLFLRKDQKVGEEYTLGPLSGVYCNCNYIPSLIVALLI